jgi:hypothetical protein
MPTLWVYEGDLKIFFASLDKLEARIVEIINIMAMVVQFQPDTPREMLSLFTSHPTFRSDSHSQNRTGECNQQCQQLKPIQ